MSECDALRQRIADLEAEVKRLETVNVVGAYDDRKRIARLEAALKVYADPSNYVLVNESTAFAMAPAIYLAIQRGGVKINPEKIAQEALREDKP